MICVVGDVRGEGSRGSKGRRDDNGGMEQVGGGGGIHLEMGGEGISDRDRR